MIFKNVLNNFRKYHFLLKQLILRDFKVKYKRSTLGVLWSLLYPLLMMGVMAFIFSNVFKFSSPGVNYLVYLMIGLTYFQYVSESTNLTMGAITSNASLINKLYIPKYIFVISKPLFIGINFLLSLFPLLLIILLTGDETTKCTITWLYLLLPFSFICLFIFATGVGFILATINVFFRDMMYIYGIVLTIWMYMTPIMYDISIIPEKYHFILKLNPLYWFIKFARDIILDNSIPSAATFIISLASASSVLLLGMFVFKKAQDKFIYYL